MKRIKQLQPLSKEHHQSLLLAQKAINAVVQDNQQAREGLCRQIADTYTRDWTVHFKIEEDSIFRPVSEHLSSQPDKSTEQMQILRLCQQLEQEHRQMDRYYEQIKQGDCSVLGDFGRLLKQHTRTEERELFPLLEAQLDSNALERILQTSLQYRHHD